MGLTKISGKVIKDNCVISGVVTASTFTGPLTGNVSAPTSLNVGVTTFHSTQGFVHNINSTGVITATSFSGGNVIMNGNDPTITMTDTSGTNDTSTIESLSGALRFTVRDGNADGEVIFRKYDGTTYDETLRITNAGNVGIGTNDPSARLDVESDQSDTDTVSGNTVFDIAHFNVSGASNQAVRFYHDDANNVTYLHRADNGGDLGFSLRSSGINSERFRIGSAGQFGIGGANYGTAGQVMKSNGASAAPTWSNLYSRYFYGEQDTQQTIAHATYTALTNFGTNNIDIGDATIAVFDEAAGTLTIGANGAGYYYLSMGAGIDDVQANDYVQIVIGKNGDSTDRGTVISPYGKGYNGGGSNQIVQANTHCMSYLSAGDVLRFYVYHNEGTSEPTEQNRCYALGYKID